MATVVIKPLPPTAPARFIGMQRGYGQNPPLELYVLLEPVGEHPIGSAVTRQTLERHGFQPAPLSRDEDVSSPNAAATTSPSNESRAAAS